MKGRPGKALRYHEEALVIARQIGDEHGVADQLGNIGNVYSDRGEPDPALKYYEEALEIHRQVGYQQGVANQQFNIGLTLADTDKHEQAVPRLVEALVIFTAIGETDGLRRVLAGLLRCENKLGRQRMEGLFKEAGLDGESIANLHKAIDQVRQAMNWRAK